MGWNHSDPVGTLSFVMMNFNMIQLKRNYSDLYLHSTVAYKKYEPHLTYYTVKPLLTILLLLNRNMLRQLIEAAPF